MQQGLAVCALASRIEAIRVARAFFHAETRKAKRAEAVGTTSGQGGAVGNKRLSSLDTPARCCYVKWR